jgi:D-glycero-alpha-D-manno-heptose-7-phosphate kinase
MKRALEAEDLNAIGEVMQFNWESQKRLYRENVTRPISNAILEAVFAAARFEGVFGGKVCGAGGGGCVVFLCQPNREHRVREAVEHIRGALLLDCNVDFKGLQTWDVNATESVPLDARLCEVERSREARHSTASSFAHPWTGGALPQPVGPGSRR